MLNIFRRKRHAREVAHLILYQRNNALAEVILYNSELAKMLKEWPDVELLSVTRAFSASSAVVTEAEDISLAL